MRYWNSYDIYWDTYINKWFTQIVPLIEKYFEFKKYGEDVEELNTIINCSPGETFKVRNRFSRKNKELYFDVVISYEEYMSLDTEEKKKELIAISFLKNMDVLSKYKPKDFVLSDLKNDFKMFFQNIGWLKQ
jgi:hypothetical protein